MCDQEEILRFCVSKFIERTAGVCFSHGARARVLAPARLPRRSASDEKSRARAHSTFNCYCYIVSNFSFFLLFFFFSTFSWDGVCVRFHYIRCLWQTITITAVCVCRSPPSSLFLSASENGNQSTAQTALFSYINSWMNRHTVLGISNRLVCVCVPMEWIFFLCAQQCQ